MAELVPFHQAGSLPPELEAQALELQRKRAIAAALDAQTSQPMQSRMAGDRVVPNTLAEGLTHIGAALMSRNASDRADTLTQELAKKYQSGMIEALARFKSKSEGTEGVPQDYQESDPRPLPRQNKDPQGAAVEAIMSGYGPVVELGKLQFAEEKARKLEREKHYILHPGDIGVRGGVTESTNSNRRQGDKSIPENWKDFLPAGVKPGSSPGTYIGPDGDTIQVKYEDGKPVDSHMVNPLPTNKNADGTPVLPPVRLKPGERYKAGTNMQEVEAIPGSDLYIAQAQKHGKELGALNTIDAATKNATDKIDYILSEKNKGAFNSNFGGYNAMATQYLPGATQDMRKKIESLKSDMKKAGLDVIRSGGSIGQMTEREWPIVERMIDSIDPVLGEKNARDVIGKIKIYIEKLGNSAKEVYHSEWSNTQYFRKPAVPVDEEAAYQAWKAKQGK